MEVGHHHHIRLALAARKRQLPAVLGPCKSEYFATGEVGQLEGIAPGEALLPNVGGAVAGERESDRFAIGGEYRRLPSVGNVERVQRGSASGGRNDQLDPHAATLDFLRQVENHLSIR